MKPFLLGAGTAVLGRAALPRLLKLKFDRDVRALDAGDSAPLLASFADDFVLNFHDGPHRWAGVWRGKDGMERFLERYTAAKVQGQIKEIATTGPPWRMTMWVRFDDFADGPDGTRLYENQTVLVLRTRWGKVVEQTDYYVDTNRIAEFDRRLVELEAAPPVAVS